MQVPCLNSLTHCLSLSLSHSFSSHSLSHSCQGGGDGQWWTLCLQGGRRLFRSHCIARKESSQYDLTGESRIGSPCPALEADASLSHSLSLSLTHSLSLSLTITLSLSHFLFTLSLSLSPPPPPLSLSLSHPLSLTLSLSLIPRRR